MNDIRPVKSNRNFSKRIKEARIGDPQAQYDVGLMYANGSGVERNVAEALTWFKAASKKGHASAQYLLGSAYANGVGTAKDEFQALQWFLKAAEQGSDKALFKLTKVLDASQEHLVYLSCLRAAGLGLADAQWMMGELYRTGRCVAQDDAQAFEWFEKSAAQGFARAQVALGNAYLQGRGCAVHVQKAAALFRSACVKGAPTAQMALHDLDRSGEGRSGDGRKRGRKQLDKERRNSDERWTAFAESGDAEDRYALGRMFAEGIAVEKSEKQATHWFQLAAQQGHAQAQFALGQALIASDNVAAASWCGMAAHQGHAHAQFEMGRRFAHGDGVDRHPLLSLSWYLRSAEQDCAAAKSVVGQLLEQGDPAAAFNCFEQAANLGDTQAQCNLGAAYVAGKWVMQDYERAAHWFNLAAERGSAVAQCELAGLYASGQGVAPSLSQAVSWYEQAVAQDFPKAQWRLGSILASGGQGVEPDAKRASSLCRKAADAGFAPAQATLGTLFAAAKKYDRAAMWWGKAAVQGDLEALFNLATACRTGSGVVIDLEKAFALTLQAAEGGLAPAQARLGVMYAAGEGVAADSIEATKWFLIAASRGDSAAQSNVQKAQTLFGPAPLTEANRRAKAWNDQHSEKH